VVRGMLMRIDLLAWALGITVVLVLMLWLTLFPPGPPLYQDDLTPDPKSPEELERSYPSFHPDPSAEPTTNFERETTI
jgi:hypothetical protein